MLRTSNATVILLCLIITVSGSATASEDLASMFRPEAGTPLVPPAVATPNSAVATPPAATHETSTEAAPIAKDAASAASAAGTSSPPGTSDAAAEPAKAGSTPRIWIWQGRDDTPVPVQSRKSRPSIFNPLTDSGFRLNMNGNAYLGYISETQNTAPPYKDLNAGFALNASGFLYSPQLLGYQVWTAYDRSNLGYGNRDSSGNGLSYGGSLFLLQATPVPFSVSFMRTANDYGGTLSTPFNSEGSSTEINGIVRRLPVKLSYHFGVGNSDTVTEDGHDFGFRYRSGDVSVSKRWAGFNVSVADNYFRSRTLSDSHSAGIVINLNDTTQTTNNLRLILDRSFGSRVTMYADGTVSDYRVESQNIQSSDARVASIGAGLHWNVTSKLDLSFTSSFSHNAANILQLLSLSGGVPLPNPLPGVTVLNTNSLTFASTASYRPSQNWTLGATASYSTVELPPLLAVGVPTPSHAPLTNGTMTENASAAYTHRVWKFDYTGVGSVGLQSYSYASGDGGSAKIFSVSNGIAGGDESRLRYGVRFTIDHANNPVFFSLLNTSDRVLDVDLARRTRLVRLDARIAFSQREIQYADSNQHLNGVDLMVTATRSKLTVTASHFSSDANQLYFALVSPIGGGIGGPPPPVSPLAPVVFSRYKNDAIMASWRPRHNLQIDSRYTRFRFTITGQSNDNQETWFDNSALYHFGRFDLVGGFIHASGHTGTSEKRISRFYFRIRFPFQLL